ncbi:hypothetical protein C4J81_16375 [Deltaproteobacteria bacterium Smac51]|nr:hypothetical protein C4J81_16375 [Deltaproteobacteria bacterium Smac51]
MAEHLALEVALPPKQTKKAISVRISAASSGVRAELKVRSGRLPLINYDVQPQAVTARKGVRSKNWPDFTFALRRGRTQAGRSRIEGASLLFIARMNSGHLGVYYRTGNKSKSGRGQVKESIGPSVQYHAAAPEVEAKIVKRAGSSFPGILARYVDQAIADHSR